MSKGKTRLGLLGLCASAVMAIMAFGGASAAQAAGCTAAEPTAKPCWMLNGNNVTSNTAVTAVLKNDELTILLSKAISTTISIDCTEQELASAIVEPEGKATGEIKFKSCSTTLGGTASAPCKPEEPVVAGGTLKITLHEKEPVVLATGNPNFTSIVFPDPDCGLPDEIAVHGNLWVLDCIGDPETELTSHLIEEGKLAASMLGGLKFGAEPMSLDGSLIIEQVKVSGSAALNFSILAD